MTTGGGHPRSHDSRQGHEPESGPATPSGVSSPTRREAGGDRFPQRPTGAIDGYRDLDQTEVAAINAWKALENTIASHWKSTRSMVGVDQRWLAVARTHFQEAVSAAVKSIARPNDPYA